MSHQSHTHRLPLSPASPPESGVKQQPKTEVFGFARPRTPPSPDHMSVATKRYVSPYQDSRHTNEMADRPMPQNQRPSISNHTAQSPATLKRSLPQDAEEGPTSKRQRTVGGGDNVDVESSYIATNHDRQDEPAQAERVVPSEASAVVEVSGKDKAELDAIFKDVGPALRLRNTSREKKKPLIDTSKHVLGIYGLHDLLGQVARKDPTTNEKINKLRKSYEGQIKAAELSGRNKPHKQERTSEDPEHSNMFHWATLQPQRFTEEIRVPAKTGDLNVLRKGLRDALRLNSGTMDQKTQKDWDETLGHEPPKPAVPVQSSYAMPSAPSRVPSSRPGQVPAPAIEKPKTRGKKRGYDDNAWDGYGSGYGGGGSEDEAADGDTDYMGEKNKKRRKTNN